MPSRFCPLCSPCTCRKPRPPLPPRAVCGRGNIVFVLFGVGGLVVNHPDGMLFSLLFATLAGALVKTRKEAGGKTPSLWISTRLTPSISLLYSAALLKGLAVCPVVHEQNTSNHGVDCSLALLTARGRHSRLPVCPMYRLNAEYSRRFRRMYVPYIV